MRGSLFWRRVFRMGKRISIVFQEGEPTSEGPSFDVFLDGMTAERRAEIDAMTPDEQLAKLSTAEFWALRCFQITMASMVRAGAVRAVMPRKG